MNPTIKNILAVLLGMISGMIVNMGLVKLGTILLPIPNVSSDDLEALKAAMPNLSFKYFIFPFMAHAFGTLVGAFVTASLSTNYKMTMSLIIGAFFLLGGISMVIMMPSPWWFNILDLVVAYFPMAYLGAQLAGAKGFRK